MSEFNASSVSLPRRLNIPFHTFFRFLVIAYMVASILAVLAWLGSGSSNLLVAVGIGGGVVAALGLAVFGSWQSLTVFEDRLVFKTLKTEQVVFYRDVGEVEAWRTKPGPNGIPNLMVCIRHRGQGRNPLAFSLEFYAAKDRVLLLQLIKAGNPNARLNPLAEKVRQG